MIPMEWWFGTFKNSRCGGERPLGDEDRVNEVIGRMTYARIVLVNSRFGFGVVWSGFGVDLELLVLPDSPTLTRIAPNLFASLWVWLLGATLPVNWSAPRLECPRDRPRRFQH